MTPPKIVPLAFVSRGSMVTRIAGNRSLIVVSLSDPLPPAAAGGRSHVICQFCLLEEWIVPPFMANTGRLSVTWNHKRVVVKRHELFLNGIDDLGMRPAP